MALTVCIAGAGIGGLALAALLARDGHAVTVLERSTALLPLGAGIVLAPNAMAVLDALGLAGELQANGFLPDTMTVTDARGRPLTRLDTTHLEHRFGGMVAVHRAVLQAALLRAAGTAPQLGVAVQSAQADADGVTVRASDGTERRVDVLIGADGAHSAVRSAVFGEVPIRYAGTTCWRFVVEHTLALRATVEMWGPGKRFGIVPIAETRAYCFGTQNGPVGGRDGAPDEALVALRARFAGFGGDVPALLAALDTTVPLLRDDLGDLPTIHLARGRVGLIGDAAHAMTPNLGQGAGMALEDALVLARCLQTGEDPARALLSYADQRGPRVRWVRDQSRRIGQVGQLGPPLLCWARDRIMRLTPPSLASRSFLRLIDEAP